MLGASVSIMQLYRALAFFYFILLTVLRGLLIIVETLIALGNCEMKWVWSGHDFVMVK